MDRHEPTRYDLRPTALLSLDDLANVLAVSRRTVERLVGRGELASFRVGQRRRLVKLDDVQAYIERARETRP